MKMSISNSIKYSLLWLFLALPFIASAQEDVRTIYKAQGRVISLSFSICHKDSLECEKHSAWMHPDSFSSEARLDNKLVASIQGTYNQAYSRYFEKVYEIPDTDFDLLCRLQKTKSPGEQIYTIEIRTNGTVKKYEIVSPKKKDVPHRLVNQFKKVEALALAIRKTQNAYDKKAVILNNQ